MLLYFQRAERVLWEVLQIPRLNEHRLQNTIKTIWSPSCLQPPLCLHRPAPAQPLYMTQQPSAELKCYAFQFPSVVGPFFTHCPH